jgi:hypothetical protein
MLAVNFIVSTHAVAMVAVSPTCFDTMPAPGWYKILFRPWRLGPSNQVRNRYGLEKKPRLKGPNCKVSGRMFSADTS